MIKVDIIKGVEGIAIYFDDYRICGNKPWGGGKIIASWEIELKDFGEELLLKIKKELK